MTNKIILFITVLSYSIIASQPFMYMLALKYTQMHLTGKSYAEVRKLIDVAMRSNYKFVLYTAVFATLALMAANIKNPSGLMFITASVAFVSLVADILLTVKGSIPINDVINTWTVDNNVPGNWTEYRDSWFRIFRYREIAAIIGFGSILIGTVFGK